jgi:cytochrome P450
MTTADATDRTRSDADFFDPAFLQDPYPVYEEIRAIGNVVWSDVVNGWLVVGYDENAAVLADTTRYAIMSGDPAMVPWFEAPNMITVDGAYHRRLRGALAPFFTRSAVAPWEDRVAAVVQELLEPLVAGRDSLDLIADFTRVPTIIVVEMLGVPPDRQDDFMRWSHAIVSNLSYGHEDDARRAVLAQASAELNAFFKEEIERHRRDEPDDLLTTMLRFTGDNAMTDDEIRSTGILLLVAGYDTTAKTMSNALIALEANPEQRALVVDDLSLVPAAVEEAMRWNGAVQWQPRRVARDTELGGTLIAAGETVYPLVAAANRDPRRWDRADRFDVLREPKAHLAFGYGPHLCLGAPLARIEVKVALEQLLRLVPEYRLRDIDFGNAIFIRGPERGTVDVGTRVVPVGEAPPS